MNRIKSSSQKYQSLFLSFFCFLLALFAILVNIGIVNIIFENIYYLIPLGIFCFLPTIISIFRNDKIDPFEPIQPSVIATLLYLVVQPFFLLRQDMFKMLGVNYEHSIPKLVMFSIFSLSALYLGYYVYPQSSKPSTTKESEAATSKYILLYSWIPYIISIFLLILWIGIARIPLRSLWALGEAGYLAWHKSPGIQIGYLYGARNALATSVLLILGNNNKKRFWTIGSIILIFTTTIFLAGMGSRTLALSVVLSSWILYYLKTKSRPSTIVLLIVMIVVTIFIGFIGYYRIAGDIRTDDINSDDVINRAIRSSNLAIGTTIILEKIPDYLDFEWGRSLIKIIVQPIPKFIWPSKYNFFYNTTHAREFQRIMSTGSSWFLWAEFYRHFGLVGVILSMVLFGILTKKFHRYYLINQESIYAKISLAASWVYIFTVFSRSDVGELVIRFFLTFAPLWLTKWLTTHSSK